MAIALVGTTEGTGVSVTSLTFSVNAGSGSNRMMVSGTYITPASGDPYTGATYAAAALTQLANVGLGGANKNIHLDQKIAPATGSNNYVANTSASATITVCVNVYTGCAQTLATGNAIKFTDDATSTSSRTLQPVSITDDSWAFATALTVDTVVTTGGTNFTTQSTLNATFPSGDSAGALGTAGTETVTIVALVSTRWEMAAIVFAPSAAPGPVNVKTKNGLAIASVKTDNGLAISSVKSINGLA